MSSDTITATATPRADDERAPGAAPARRAVMPRLVLGVVALVALGWGIRSWLHGRAHVSTDNAQVDGHVTMIAPKVQAFVDEVRVDDNDRVQAGDTLVRLDARDFVVRLRQAEAELASARAAVGDARTAGQLVAQLRATEAQAAGLDATVQAAEARLARAEADLGRVQGLAAQRIVPAQQLDAARTTRDAAAADLTAARRQAAAARSQITAGAAALTGAQARLASAAAAVDAAKLSLAYTVITAPTSGTVARRSVEPGALVQAGQSLMAVVPDSAVWVTANLKETQLAEVRVGQPVHFTVDAYPGRTFEGTVESLSPATGARFALLPPDNATGNFTKVVQRVPVRIAVATTTPDAPLRPGMSVEVDIRIR